MGFRCVIAIPEAVIEAVGNTKEDDTNGVTNAAYKKEDKYDDERDCPASKSFVVLGIGLRL
jgi:hypothetical protein